MSRAAVINEGWTYHAQPSAQQVVLALVLAEERRLQIEYYLDSTQFLRQPAVRTIPSATIAFQGSP